MLALMFWKLLLNARRCWPVAVAVVVGVVLVAAVVWAPPERADLAIALFAPLLAVVLSFWLRMWWARRRLR